MRLSRSMNKFVKAENYLLFKKFLRLYSIHFSRKYFANLAEVDVIDLIKDCVQIKSLSLDAEEL